MFIILSTVLILNESCKKEENCPIINCNSGIQNEETCVCNCPTGFSGLNCENENICVTQNIICENGGVCVDGTCDCPDGYIGTNCESFDPNQVQVLLDGGRTPFDLFNGNIPLDSLYGKMYKDGIIFYLNITNGTGMIAAKENQSTEVKWGCYEMDIQNLSNVFNSATNPETENGARIGDGEMNTDAILAECMEIGIAARLCRDVGLDRFLPSRGELNLIYTNLIANGHGEFPGGWYWSSTESNSSFAWVQFLSEADQNSSSKNSSKNVRAVRAF